MGCHFVALRRMAVINDFIIPYPDKQEQVSGKFASAKVEAGDEVHVAFEAGNPREPYVLEALWKRNGRVMVPGLQTVGAIREKCPIWDIFPVLASQG